MSIADLIFQVEFTEVSFRFYEKDFAKKYLGRQWSETKLMIRVVLERAYSFFKTDKIDFLRPLGEGWVAYKLDFPVAGSGVSAKGSGNRVIFALSNDKAMVRVLLVYGKNHLPKNMLESQWIYKMIKEKYPEYKKVS